MERTARQKADSVEQLLRRNDISPDSILELGCGTGAVLRELQNRRLARHLYGVDYSEEAIRHLKSSLPGVQCAVADITEDVWMFDQSAFDVVLCSHVLEHLETPLAILQAVKRLQFDHLLVEVPLEDLAFGRLKAVFIDRGRNPSGHVQFFIRRSLLQLLKAAQFTVIDKRLYVPLLDMETIRFAYRDNGLPRYLHKLLTEHIGPRFAPRLWSRWYHAHYAVLCQSTG